MIVALTESGIMVDGAEVGSKVRFLEKGTEGTNASITHYQSLEGADLLVLVDDGRIPETDGQKEFILYGIYGDNKMVSCNVNESTIVRHHKKLEAKLILGNKKPYILNGD